MPQFETLFLVSVGVVLLAAVVVMLAIVRHSRAGRAAGALGRGSFEEALAAADTGPDAGREELYAAAVAARHLLRLDQAAGLLDRILAGDPADGEALLERALVAAYAGDPERAGTLLAQAAAARADLAESVTLHRAWLALRRGRRAEARRFFEEVEVSLESKLRTDLGGGDPLFAEWFLHAAVLWRALGDDERAAWAWKEGLAAAPASRLAEGVGGFTDPGRTRP